MDINRIENIYTGTLRPRHARFNNLAKEVVSSLKIEFTTKYPSYFDRLKINFNTKLLANEFNFEAKNIETIEENIISASDEVYIYDNLGNKIFSDKLLIDNKAKIYTIKENVILKNENNEITLNANEIIFNQSKNTIISIGKTKISKNNNFPSQMNFKNITLCYNFTL